MERKGRSGLAGVALGVFLGLIGIVICYLLSDKTEKEPLAPIQVNVTHTTTSDGTTSRTAE